MSDFDCGVCGLDRYSAVNPHRAHHPKHLDGGAVTMNAQRAWRYTSDTGEL